MNFLHKTCTIVFSVILLSVLGCTGWQGESLGGLFAYNKDENSDDPLKKRSGLSGIEKNLILTSGDYCQNVFNMYKKWEDSGNDSDLKTWVPTDFTLVGGRPLDLIIKRPDITQSKPYLWVYHNDAEKKMIIICRSTEHIAEWELNAMFGQVDSTVAGWKGSGAKEHEGFHLAVKDLVPKFLSLIAIQTIDLANLTSVKILGYSLGGGIAPLFAVSIIQHLDNSALLEVVTFGGPRVGNKAWADCFGDLIKKNKLAFYPVINVHDPISHIPSSLVYHYTRSEAVLVEFGPSLSHDSPFKLLENIINSRDLSLGIKNTHVLPNYIKAVREQW